MTYKQKKKIKVRERCKKDIHKVLLICAKVFKTTVPEIRSKTRKEPTVTARHFAMYYIRNLYPKDGIVSWSFIGKEINGSDHATVFHVGKELGGKIEFNAELKEKFEIIDKKFKGIKIEEPEVKIDTSDIEYLPPVIREKPPKINYMQAYIKPEQLEREGIINSHLLTKYRFAFRHLEINFYELQAKTYFKHVCNMVDREYYYFLLDYIDDTDIIRKIESLNYKIECYRNRSVEWRDKFTTAMKTVHVPILKKCNQLIY